MDTKRVVFYNEGGHEGLINACDFDEKRHREVGAAPVEPAGQGESFDATPGGISTVNVSEAKDLIAEATTVAALDALEAAEAASVKSPGGRKSILKAIEDRRAELAE